MPVRMSRRGTVRRLFAAGPERSWVGGARGRAGSWPVAPGCEASESCASVEKVRRYPLLVNTSSSY